MDKNRLPSKVALALGCTLRQCAGVLRHKALGNEPERILVSAVVSAERPPSETRLTSIPPRPRTRCSRTRSMPILDESIGGG